MARLMFLTPADIERLTGKRRPSAQVRWLRKHGYRLTVNGLGEPIVAVAEANRKLVGGVAAQHEQPNWNALRGQAPQA